MYLSEEQEATLEEATITELAELMQNDYLLLNGMKTEANGLFQNLIFSDNNHFQRASQLARLLKINQALALAGEYLDETATAARTLEAVE